MNTNFNIKLSELCDDYVLKFKDADILTFNLDTGYIFIHNVKLLPYAFKGYLVNSKELNIKEVYEQLNFLKDWLCNRVLSLSRTNAKLILSLSGLPQVLRTPERLQVVLACRALQMQDDYWICKTVEHILYKDVCLRKQYLSSRAYFVSMEGIPIIIGQSELIPDLTTLGTFLKCWRLNDDKVKLYKSDLVNGSTAMCEIESSSILKSLGVNCVEYIYDKLGDKNCSVCSLINDDTKYLISALELRDYCVHNNLDFLETVLKIAPIDFPNMVVGDYLIFNTDRHIENWGFLVDNSNRILGMAPLYDFNLSNINTSVFNPDMVYEPTGLSLIESARKYLGMCSIDISKIENPTIISRYNKLLSY